MGFYPTKEGQSYEKIVGAALKIIYSDKKIIWDERKRGEYDKNIYQIDVGLYSIDNESVMVESKDHTKFKSCVQHIFRTYAENFSPIFPKEIY